MADNLILAKKESLSAIATAIKEESESSESLVFPTDFISKIRTIKSGSIDKFVSRKIQSFTTAGTDITGRYAFAGCTNLESATINCENQNRVIPDHCFNGCTNLVEVTAKYSDVGGAMTASGTSCFEQCVALESIALKSGGDIGQKAFYGCTGLTGVEIQTSSGNVGEYAFYGCSNLESFNIGSDCHTIGDYAFCSSGISEISSPASGVVETEIGNHSFENCLGLVDVIIPEGVISIGEYAFSGCVNLRSITLPVSLVSVGDYAFNGCTSLTTITFKTAPKNGVERNSSLYSIGNYAFNNCTSLRSITVPYHCYHIYAYAFRNCSSMTSCVIDSGNNNGSALLITIGEYAFQNCVALKNFTIPKSVTKVNRYAFQNCTALEYIRFMPTVPPNIGSTILSGWNTNVFKFIYVPGTTSGNIFELYYNADGLTSTAYRNKLRGWGS